MWRIIMLFYVEVSFFFFFKKEKHTFSEVNSSAGTLFVRLSCQNDASTGFKTWVILSLKCSAEKEFNLKNMILLLYLCTAEWKLVPSSSSSWVILSQNCPSAPKQRKFFISDFPVLLSKLAVPQGSWRLCSESWSSETIHWSYVTQNAPRQQHGSCW